jgi:hypothetical protein
MARYTASVSQAGYGYQGPMAMTHPCDTVTVTDDHDLLLNSDSGWQARYASGAWVSYELTPTPETEPDTDRDGDGCPAEPEPGDDGPKPSVITINVSGAVTTERELIRAVEQAVLRKAARRSTNL